MPTTHVVESTPQTVRSGYLDPAARPVATVVPGDMTGSGVYRMLRRRAGQAGYDPAVHPLSGCERGWLANAAASGQATAFPGAAVQYASAGQRLPA